MQFSGPQTPGNSKHIIHTATKQTGPTGLEYTYVVPNPLLLVLRDTLRYPGDIADLLHGY